MKLFYPLQLFINSQVLEQDRKFYFIVTASLGIHLQTGKTRLSPEYIKDVFDSMGDTPRPDLGMPKPRGEYLVSGSFFSANGLETTGGEVKVKLGDREKKLMVFGPRTWKTGRAPRPEPILSMPIDYAHAFGGKKYAANPEGMGYQDGLLPCIETPGRLVASPKDSPEPAGFAPLDPSWPQRMKFQGTYNENYKQEYYPGFPADHDWRYFMGAPADQWIDGYFSGDEPFEIHHMHPEIPVIRGKLPNLVARCFIRSTVFGTEPALTELALNLDTVWFFPDKLLALLIWRKGIEVADDEGAQISHILGAYEDRKDPPRSLDYYKAAFDLRMKGDDLLLNNLNTEDLVAVGHPCAMEMLQDGALAGGEESALSRNMNAKAEEIQQQVDEKIEEAIRQSEKNLADIEMPSEAKDQFPDGGKPDLRKIIQQGKDAPPDPDVQALNAKLESILPGITAGDPSKLELKKFSFDKMDQLMEAVNELTEKKGKEAKELAKQEIEKAKKEIQNRIDQAADAINQLSPEDKAKLDEQLKTLDEIDLDAKEPPPAPLPRLDANEILAQMPPLAPQVHEAMQHIQAMKNAGVENADTRNLEQQIEEMLGNQEEEIKKALKDAQKGFWDGYFMGAHFMAQGLSPHKETVEEVTQRFLDEWAAGRDLSGRDWACIDLSGKALDGVNLSRCFLEQVNFKGASLTGADLSGSILARAILDNADLTGANLEGANIGGVHANQANFTEAILKGGKLSKGDFTGSDFTRCDLEGVESLEVIVDNALFEKTHMPAIKFIEIPITGARFLEADMAAAMFVKCSLVDADFSGAHLSHSLFAESPLEQVRFDGADMESACFVAGDFEGPMLTQVRFCGSALKQANFQGLTMKGADLSGANLENANFLEADLSDANLTGAYAKSALFRKANLTGARADRINLMEGSLAKARLVDASFVGANLYAVDFLRSTITNTDFTGCNLDATLIEHWRPK